MLSNYYQTSLVAAYLIKVAGIFQDSEHLYDFQTVEYDGHFVF